LQPLMNSLHSYLVLLTLLVILIQSLPHSSNNANLFSSKSQNNILNLSLSTGVFSNQFKICSVHPILKESNLDKENLSSYRAMSQQQVTGRCLLDLSAPFDTILPFHSSTSLQILVWIH
jgi:hypothetical protein